MKTGVSLGFKVGDFVFTGHFPGIIISDVRTFAPCCEVWGFEHELGSAYAEEMVKLDKDNFLKLCARNGHVTLDPISKVSKTALA